MKSIRFKKADNFIIFGGGDLIVDICSILKKKNKQIVVLTSKQQSEDLVFKNTYTLKGYLKKYKIKHKVLKNIKNLNKFNFINKNSIGISNSCRWIFKKRDIKLFKNRIINIHYSNLPSFMLDVEYAAFAEYKRHRKFDRRMARLTSLFSFDESGDWYS